ncbi:hypothetical protein PR048_025439 [Dryococelus australis]|uniref:Uncharacterized protein n=1 Tax=Dryococelus australis TaxID=614101 RepID=A0ABQ9GRD7_9NEOP|nr:hypothetical protein PR048_025439 [Dryococelus australis]
MLFIAAGLDWKVRRTPSSAERNEVSKPQQSSDVSRTLGTLGQERHSTDRHNTPAFRPPGQPHPAAANRRGVLQVEGAQTSGSGSTPERTRRPTATSAMFPTCETPGDPAGNRTLLGGECSDNHTAAVSDMEVVPSPSTTEISSQKQSNDIHRTPYDRVECCRERKINIKASERVNAHDSSVAQLCESLQSKPLFNSRPPSQHSAGSSVFPSPQAAPTRSFRRASAGVLGACAARGCRRRNRAQSKPPLPQPHPATEPHPLGAERGQRAVLREADSAALCSTREGVIRVPHRKTIYDWRRASDSCPPLKWAFQGASGTLPRIRATTISRQMTYEFFKYAEPVMTRIFQISKFGMWALWCCNQTTLALPPPLQGEPGLIPGGVAPVSSYVGIVADDVAGQRVFSEISHFPPPFHSGAASHAHQFTLIGSHVYDVKTHRNLFTHSCFSTVLMSKGCCCGYPQQELASGELARGAGRPRLADPAVCRNKFPGNERNVGTAVAADLGAILPETLKALPEDRLLRGPPVRGPRSTPAAPTVERASWLSTTLKGTRDFGTGEGFDKLLKISERLDGMAAIFDAQFTSPHQRLSDMFENTIIVPNNPCSCSDADDEVLFGFHRGLIHQAAHIVQVRAQDPHGLFIVQGIQDSGDRVHIANCGLGRRRAGTTWPLVFVTGPLF